MGHGVLTPRGLPQGANLVYWGVPPQVDCISVVTFFEHWVLPGLVALALEVCSDPCLGVWHCYFDHYFHYFVDFLLDLKFECYLLLPKEVLQERHTVLVVGWGHYLGACWGRYLEAGWGRYLETCCLGHY